MRAGGPDPLATVFFLSDYGLQDEFAGVVKAVLRRESPQVTVVDLSHEISPYDVRAGARMLERAAPFVAPGIFLAIVDPGVGSARRAVAIEVVPDPGRGPESASVLVGPDNGLLVPAARALGTILLAVEVDQAGLDPQTGEGPTFAGRDVFAPAVARIANRTPLCDLGAAIDPDALEPGPPAVLVAAAGRALTTEVVWEDRFGNLELAATVADLPETVESTRELLIRIPGERFDAQPGGPCQSKESSQLPAGKPLQAPSRSVTACRVRTFAEIPPGKVGLLVDSYGKLTLACRESSAAMTLAVHPGEKLHLISVE